MASKIELAKQYLTYQREQKTDDSLAMLVDDVVMSNPMTGTITGKAALQSAMANRPAGGMTIEWGEPQEDGAAVKIIGTGSPFGPVQIVLGFDGDNLISRIDIGLA